MGMARSPPAPPGPAHTQPGGRVSSSRAHPEGGHPPLHVGKDMGPRPGEGGLPCQAPGGQRVLGRASSLGYSHSPASSPLAGRRRRATLPWWKRRKTTRSSTRRGFFAGRTGGFGPSPPAGPRRSPGQGTPHTGGPVGQADHGPQVHHGLVELAGKVRGDHLLEGLGKMALPLGGGDIGVIPHHPAATRRRFPSTAGTGWPKAMEAMAAAVYSPTPARLRRSW